MMRLGICAWQRVLAVGGLIGLLSACNGDDTTSGAHNGAAAEDPPADSGSPPPQPPAPPPPDPVPPDPVQTPAPAPAAPEPAPTPPPPDPPAPPTAPPPSSSANLLFRSGFEGGALSLLPPLDCWGTGCWQEFTGLDSVTSFSWPGNVWGGGGKFLMLTDPVSITPVTVGDYVFNRMDWVPGPRGANTTALFQQISRNANGTSPMGTSPSQNEYMFLPKQEPGDMYVSYWMKLQPDLVEKMNNLPAGPGISGGGTWRAIFALKTGGQTSWGGPADNGDYRIEAYVMTSGGGQPYWVLVGDNNAGGGAPMVNNFRIDNRSVPVPVGEWFKFEIFWHRSAGSEGRVWMAIDGQVIADRQGANMGAWSMPINRIMAPILYSGGVMPIYQWVDDVEIWDGFPGQGDNPPYAAH